MKTNDEYKNEATANSQCNRILDYMQQGLAITSYEALQMFGCFRLASRIHDLRERGNNITVERVKTANGKTVAQYRLV